MRDKDREGQASDRALIARWREGDQRAAAELVARHAPALARYAASMGERDEVEELVQDTFVRAFGSLDGFREESTLLTWLFTIERRLLVDRRRTARRNARLTEIDEEHAVTAANALDGVVAIETEERVRRAVERLTPTQREVFLLRVNEGLSYREIAGLVGTTEGAARVHYHNALRTVKEWIDD